MKIKSALLLGVVTIAGCGGTSTSSLNGPTLDPGYYAVTSRVLRSGNAASDYAGRVSVSSTGTIRVFGIDPNGTKLSIVRTGGTANENGTNAVAVLNGATSSGDLYALADNLVSFDGPAFTLTANGSLTGLPTVGTGRTISAGIYSGELVRVGADGAATDWGNARGVLTVSTPNSGPPVSAITVTLTPTVASNGTVSAELASNGTAESAAAATTTWSSDGATFVLKLAGGTQGTTSLYAVLTRQPQSQQ